MRLLNAATLEFKFFWDLPKTQKYAILSHTWLKDEEEPTFQDFQNGAKKDTLGYRKIVACCEQARKDDYDYVWIDTCCIDKTNAHELSETINSMFKWYKGCEVCYAYLEDYPPEPIRKTYVGQSNVKEDNEGDIANGKAEDASQDIVTKEFRKCKWFKRGWTLQELIAPQTLVFFSKDWKNIGSKMDRCHLIHEITKISPEVLANKKDALEKSSVAQRMSWASGRSTKRAEDIAYCLLGIFDVHMPLIYGEGGEKAFIRLQKQIIEQSDDHSLFAWRDRDGKAGHGLLALSPEQFSESSRVIRIPSFEPRSAYRMTHRGLEIELEFSCTLDGKDHFATLGCAEPQKNVIPQDEDDIRDNDEWESREGSINQIAFLDQIGIYLAHIAGNRFARIRHDQLKKIEYRESHYQPATLHTIYLPPCQTPPIQKKYEFHMMELVLLDKVDWAIRLKPLRKVRAWLLPLQAGKAFVSRTKAQIVHFDFVGCTSAGRQVTSREFVLGVRGKVGVFFKPSQGYIGTMPVINPAKVLKFIAVVFGIGLDGSCYVDISGISWPQFEQSRPKRGKVLDQADSRGTSDKKIMVPVIRSLDHPRDTENEMDIWFEEYVKKFTTSSSSKRVEKEIWDLIFSVEIYDQKKREGMHKSFRIDMSYRSTWQDIRV